MSICLYVYHTPIISYFFLHQLLFCVFIYLTYFHGVHKEQFVSRLERRLGRWHPRLTNAARAFHQLGKCFFYFCFVFFSFSLGGLGLVCVCVSVSLSLCLFVIYDFIDIIISIELKCCYLYTHRDACDGVMFGSCVSSRAIAEWVGSNQKPNPSYVYIYIHIHTNTHVHTHI